MNERKLGKYEIRAILGRGAAGVVYEGWDPAIARRVAIKTVRVPDDASEDNGELLARARREAQAAGRLNHPNIVGVFDYGEIDGTSFIVMEYVDGRTLKTVLDSGEHLPPAEIVRLMTALLQGLQYSHDNGVVHRDIKPANIMLTSQGQLKIADFGIARIESSTVTQIGTMMGTPAYMSPEQFMGHSVDRRSDIYSTGVVLYQLVTGDRPFDGSMTSIMHKALNTEPSRPSELSVIASPAIDAVVARAMAKQPEDRFDTADAFAHALREAFSAPPGKNQHAEETIVRRPVQAAISAAAAPRRRLAPRVIGCGLLLAGFIAGVWYLTRQNGAIQEATLSPKPPLSVNSRPTLVELRAALQKIGCTLTSLTATDNGAIMIEGLGGAGEPESALHKAIAAVPVEWRVQRVDGPYCDALDDLRGLVAGGNRSAGQLSIRLKDDVSTLPSGSDVVIRLTIPDFPAMLQIDYLSSDGSVTHLVHDDGTKLRVASDDSGALAWNVTGSSRRYPAGATVIVGDKETSDPQGSFGSWTVDQPYGTDMILAIAASSPVFASPRPPFEQQGPYLHDLRAAILDAQARGVKLAGQAILLQTTQR